MKLKQLETFLWVATLGSFRKVAEQMHTTQPAISSRIAALETALGEKLFERGSRSVTLSAFGQTIVPYAEKVIAMSERLRAQAKSAGGESGVLRLGVSESIVHTWLPAFLRRLHGRHPNLNVELTVDVTANLREELAARALDLAFLLGPLSSYEIENIRLCSYPLVWAASPALGFPATGVPVGSIARHRILTFARNTRPFAEIRTRLRALDGAPARITPSASLAAVKRMACDGIGVAALPAECICDEVAAGTLEVVASDWTPSDLVFTASYPIVPMRPMLETFAGLAREVAAGEAWSTL